MTKAEREKREKQHEREVLVSRTKLVLIVVCLIAIPVTFLWNHRDVGSVNNRVARIESPCLKASEEPTKLNKRLCRESFEKAISTITHAEACAVERKAGTLKALRELAHSLDVNVKEPCRGARLAQELKRDNERAATESASTGPTADGGDASEAQPGSSQPAPGDGGSHGGGSTEVAPSGGGHKKSPEKLPPSSGGGTPPSSPPASSPSQSSSSTIERSTETVVVQPPAPVVEPPKAPVAEAVGGVVEEVGGTVAGTVEAVAEPVCELTKLLCP